MRLPNALNNDPNFATTIMALINGKADTGHKHTKSQITDFPTSMPASDVYPWAKASSKPTYTATEVGAAAAGHNHDSAYQPKGSYAAANHNHGDAYAAKTHTHTADQITDTATKVMMTKSERSKLAGLETATSLKSINGYVKVGGGIIIQWGTSYASANTNTTVSYATSFVNTYSVVMVPEDSNTSQNKSLAVC